ncbi:aminopeptidase N [Corynebacterium uropygiale]|uniref:Aminopeptidase N n=1 Tax=Corynebacterium uropygiale TaxID=1775911 RepID=A0A9X1QRQ2_9CORY|nr:aminopeptidase N [Corynebacterium uropygiale]MCF4006538.1 aminopeptidase N [Corynebacterium uropygiale]
MSESTITRQTCRERSRVVRDPHVDLALDVSRAGSGAETLSVEATWTFRSEATQTHLDYLGEVLSIQINGVERDPEACASEGIIRIDGLEPGEQARVKILGASRYSRTGQGLHRFVDGEDTYLYSHCEPSDARRIFPCFEQPDIKSRVRVSLVVPSGWKAFSLGNPEKEEELDGGRRRVTFSLTPPVSSYLTAFAAGPYVGESTTWTDPRTGVTHDVGVWCRKAMREFLDAEDFLAMTTRGLSWFCDLFDSPFPWLRYDSILVPEYNLGAMENPGLVTFAEKYIFRDQPTDAERAARANTLLHEMSHMWFGDEVTPEWWDDLWLKESFAEYMGAAASVATTAHTDAWVNFAGRRTAWAIEQDELPTTHPIAADIPDVDAARQNFDGITYAKGAAVLRQLVHFVGEDVFTDATRRYFRAHAYETATFQDYIAELSAASGRDLSEWVCLWLQTSGVDMISVEREGSCLRLRTLERPARPHRVDIGLFEVKGGVLSRRATLDVELHGEENSVDTGLPPEELAELLVLVNDHAHSYCLASLDARSLSLIDQYLSTLDDALSRTVIWQQLWNLVRRGELPPEHFVNLVSIHAWAERNATTLGTILDQAEQCVEHYTPAAQRPKARRRLATNLQSLLTDAEAGSDEQRILLGAAIRAWGAADDKDSGPTLRSYLHSEVLPGLELGPTLRWNILCALRSLGLMGEEELAEEHARDNTLTGAVRFFEATYSAPGRRAALLEKLLTPGELSNDEVRAGLAAWNRPGEAAGKERAELLGVETYLDSVEEWWAKYPMEMSTRLIAGLIPAADLEGAEAIQRWLEERPDLPGGLRRTLVESADRVRRAAEICARQEK